MRTLAAVVALYGCLGFATAQSQSEPAIFPQVAQSMGIISVAISPDGKVLASASNDTTIELWDMASGRELRSLIGHGYWVMGVAFSPDGKVLASGSGDNTIKLWDVATGRELRTLNTHFVTSVAFSPDGKYLVSGSTDKSVKIWNVASGQELAQLDGHTDYVLSVAFSPDGHTLASASRDHTVKLWDLADARELHTLTGHTDFVLSVSFSPDGHTLASASADHTIKLWDVAFGRELGTLSGHTDAVNSVIFSPDGKLLASAGSDRTARLWEVSSRRELRTMPHRDWMLSVAFSPDGKMLAAGGGGQTVSHILDLLDVASGRELRGFIGHAIPNLSSVVYSPDGKLLASGNEDTTINLWDVTAGRKLATLTGHTDRVLSVAFSPDGKTLASGGNEGAIKLWDVASGRELRTSTGHTGQVPTVAFSPDGKILASGSTDHTIKLWDAASGRELRTLKGHSKGVWSVAFTPNGKTLASSSRDMTIKLWDVASGRTLHTLTGHAEHPDSVASADDVSDSVAISPDGRMLASGSQDHTVKLWDIASGRYLRTLSGHTFWVQAVAFSPDGKTLASGSYDHTIKLWDVATGGELRSFSEFENLIDTVAFSPDGKMLASGGTDGTVREWDAASGRRRASLVAFDDGSSLAITPEGFFDSSSAQAEDYLNVRIGNRVFGIAAYRERFYRPDLVKLGLAGESLARFGSIGGNMLPPIVELASLPQTTSDPKLTITLHISDGGSGIGLVRVFLNGTAVVQDDATSGPLIRSYAVRLLDGPNELRVVAFNADGSVQSNSATAAITAHLPPAPRGTLHAVIVGIQEFPKRPQNNLTYPAADAQLVADTLKKSSMPLFERLDIKLLTTAPETDRDHIVQALTAMQGTAGPDDEFVFYVASHGLVVDGEYYLITSNVSSPDTIKSEAISRRQLASLLANIHAPKKLVIIDTCHAQPVGDALQQALQSGGMTDSTASILLSREIGSTVLAAATTDQEALEGYRDHGLFTRVVADGLGGRAALDGIISNVSLADYVGAQVPPLASNIYRHAQTPTISVNGQRFSIAEDK